MTRCVILMLLALVIAACGGPPVPTPDLAATQAAVEEAARATMTAKAPTASPRPADTSPPAPTSTPGETATPSAIPTPSSTPTPTPGSAWADEVIAFNAGAGAQSKYSTPEALLGEPDLVEDPCCRGMLQLGKGGSVLLAFTDNTIVDGDGADFQVYGESEGDDYLLVEVSADGQAWGAFPKVSESPGGLDLAEAGLAQAVYVRLTDLQPGTSTGAAVDAVVALNSGPAASLATLPDAVARGQVILREGPDGRMKEVGRAAAGEALTVLGRSPVSGWVKVQSGQAGAGWSAIADLGLNVSLGGYEVAQAPPTPTTLSTPTPKATTRTRSQDGMTMVYVPAGDFTMGSPAGEGGDEEVPQHKVTLDGLWIDRTEVTNAQYGAFVGATGHRAPTTCDWGDPTYDDGAKANHPVVCVSWDDAKAYCEWAGARLPTEAEWEKAARGTDRRTYPWGNGFDGSRVNYCDTNCESSHKDTGADDGYARTAPVGSYPTGASPYGALDMAGNVWEWVSDWYDFYYYGGSPQGNPQGPNTGEFRVLRGGSWFGFTSNARTAFRAWMAPDNRDSVIGFRCVDSSTPAP